MNLRYEVIFIVKPAS